MWGEPVREVFASHEIKVLPPGERAVAKGLLLANGRVLDIVTNAIEKPTYVEAGRWKICDGSRRERTVTPVTVERDLAILGVINHHCSRFRFNSGETSRYRARRTCQRTLHLVGEWVVAAGIENYE